MASRTFPFVAKDGRRGVIRPALPRDARRCLEVVRETMSERPRTLMVTPAEFWGVRDWRRNRIDWGEQGAWLVAELGGEVVGQLDARRGPRPSERHAIELGITVARAARGFGIGRALMEVLETWAREQGVTKLTLRVFSKNARAQALYASMGYEVEGELRRQVRFPDGEEVDTLVMAKFLDEART